MNFKHGSFAWFPPHEPSGAAYRRHEDRSNWTRGEARGETVGEVGKSLVAIVVWFLDFLFLFRGDECIPWFQTFYCLIVNVSNSTKKDPGLV